MEENNIKVKKGLNLISITICVLVISGVALNVYQFNSNNSLKNELYALEAELENLQNERNAFDTELETKREESTVLSSQLEELKNTISSLESDNESLLESLEELKTTKESLMVNNVDTGLSKEADIDAMIDQVLKEQYPDAYNYTYNNGGNGSSTTQQGNYEHVGTEDNTANTPQFQFDPNDTEGLSKDVTVY